MTRILARASLAALACTACQQDFVFLYKADSHAVRTIEQRSMDEPDALGVTGADLFAAAQDLTLLTTHWRVPRGVTPESDTFELSFTGEPQAELAETVILNSTYDTSEPYTIVRVPVTVTSLGGELTTEFELLLHSPDVATHGVYAYGVGWIAPEDVDGVYREHLVGPTNPTNPGYLRLATEPNLLYTDGGVPAYDGRPLETQLAIGHTRFGAYHFYEDDYFEGPYLCPRRRTCVERGDTR